MRRYVLFALVWLAVAARPSWAGTANAYIPASAFGSCQGYGTNYGTAACITLPNGAKAIQFSGAIDGEFATVDFWFPDTADTILLHGVVAGQTNSATGSACFTMQWEITTPSTVGNSQAIWNNNFANNALPLALPVPNQSSGIPSGTTYSVVPMQANAYDQGTNSPCGSVSTCSNYIGKLRVTRDIANCQNDTGTGFDLDGLRLLWHTAF